MGIVYCANCEGKCSDQILQCPHCGHPLGEITPPKIIYNTGFAALEREPSIFIAFILSIFIPGLGQMYKGYPLTGIAWFIITIAGYAALVTPGAVLHLVCVMGTLCDESAAAKRNRKYIRKNINN